MKLRILIVADPLSKLKAASDSSLALAHQAAARKHLVQWCESETVECENGVVYADCAPLEHYQLVERRKLSEFHVILIRRDPPFDLSYIRLCWILSLIEGKVLFVNRPSVLLTHHEKMIPLQAMAAGFLKNSELIPTYLGRPGGANRFLEENDVEDWISKPFLGFGGSDVVRMKREQVESLSPASPLLGATAMVQPFLPGVREGDRRVFFLGGKILAHFLRVPKEGSFVSNLAQGGRAEMAPLPAKEKAMLERLGKYLKSCGIVLAGADVFAGKISEVNITSPTGFRSLEGLKAGDYTEDVIRYVEASLKRRSA